MTIAILLASVCAVMDICLQHAHLISSGHLQEWALSDFAHICSLADYLTAWVPYTDAD